MNRIIIFGAPGSGKGTISGMLVKEFGFKHIAAGDLLRKLLMGNDPKYSEMRETIAQGKLIPDAQITDIIKDEIILSEQENKSILLDGYPRTLSQAKLLSDITDVNLALNIDVPFNIIIERLCDRLIHEPSGRIYNNKWSPPKVPGTDDITGEPLTKRPDDSEEVVSKRLSNYETAMSPVVKYYTDKKILKTFKGEESKVIYKTLGPFMKNFLAKN